MKPRVHWVSPLPPARTDIAHYTARIAAALAEETDLILWTDAPDWDPALQKICPVAQLDPERVLPRDFAAIRPGHRGPEAIFIQMGNSWVFHTGLLRLARRIPAIVVLHDLAIQEMLLDAINHSVFDPETYRGAMAQWYGHDGEAAAKDLLAGRIPASELGRKMPGFEIWLDKAIATLTHTAVAQSAAEARGHVPNFLHELPFQPAATPPNPARAMQGPLRLAQFGHIGRNRRLEEILEVLSSLKERLNFRFDLMGRLWDQDYIEGRIAKLGLNEHVHMHGFVAEAALDARLRQAHLVFNLRHPTMGEASGSQLRIWNAAAAAVVTDQGWYRDVPDDTVFKIQVNGEADTLRDLLLKIDQDRALSPQVGQAGWAQLNARHTPERYAETIAEIARNAPLLTQRALLASSRARVSSSVL